MPSEVRHILKREIVSSSPRETQKWGEKIGKFLSPGDVVALMGELGSGKTTLIQGIARGLEVPPGEYVRSPSFVLIHQYQGRLPLYHFDCFRLQDPRELHTLGYEEYFYGEGVTVVEWADKIESFLPDEHLRVEMVISGEKERIIYLSSWGGKFEPLVRNL